MRFNQNKNYFETINLPAGREVLVSISSYSRERERERVSLLISKFVGANACGARSFSIAKFYNVVKNESLCFVA